MYLDEALKPEVGSGLNRPAEVTMLRVHKLDKDTGRPTIDPEAVARFERKLRRVTAEQGAEYAGYEAPTGTWRFRVEHFSRWVCGWVGFKAGVGRGGQGVGMVCGAWGCCVGGCDGGEGVVCGAAGW